MIFARKTLVAAALGLAATHFTSVANADVTWTFNTTNCVSTSSATCGGGDSNFAGTRTYQGVGTTAVNVTVSGWANTTGANDRLELGEITHYSGGLGVRNADWNRSGDKDFTEGSTPEHAIDNDQRFDLVLFDFGTNPIALSDIRVGWVAGSSCPSSFCDADISLLAYEGGDAGDTPLLDGRLLTDSTEDLRAKGWVLVDNYDLYDNNSNTATGAVNPDPAGPATPVASNRWVVIAHSDAYGTSCVRDSSCANENDYFKIASVSGKLMPPPPPPPPPNTSVPVPAPLGLLGLGLLGAGYAGRRKRK